MPPATPPAFDAVCIGLNVVDILVRLPNEVHRGEKHEVSDLLVQGGAPAGNAACVLAALGARTGFLGHFGRNTLSQVARDELTQRGVRADFFIETTDARPGVATVEIDASGDRTVFYNLNGYRRVSSTDVPADLAVRTRLVLVDGYETEGALVALEQARAAGTLSVLDLEAGDPAILRRLLALGTDAILPLGGARQLTGKTEPADVLHELGSATAAQLVVTDGAAGCWALTPDGVIHQPAFSINPLDTTGCGDAFHGAYAFALLAGWALPQRLEFSAYIASRVALNLGGRSALPTCDMLRREESSLFTTALRRSLTDLLTLQAGALECPAGCPR